jgi:selenocysteine lyase/cysteine desulfurase
MPENDLQTVVGRRQREAGIADDEAADEAADRLEAVYDPTARLIGALPTENGIVENATRRWDMAFYSTPFQADDRILPSAAEYTTTVIAFHPVTERGASIEVLPDDEHGQLDVRALEAMLNDGVRMTSINC